MKTKLRFTSPNKPGFAIIATLVLMILIALIAVGLMALVSSRNRIAAQKVLYAEARQQALVGLDAAIGELQAELGPDQRVTANSAIMNSSDNGPSPYILGVWDSWDGPIYGASKSGKGGHIKETYDRGRSKMFRRWMISAKNKNELRDINAYAQMSSRMAGERICLVGEGTLGTNVNSNQFVYADLISTPARGNNTTQYAWWINGENQKAKINIAGVEETDDPEEALHRTWDTPPPSFSGSFAFPELGDGVGNSDRILTLSSLALANTSSQKQGSPYFFDVTMTSNSLPINIRHGGLKQDLSLLLNKETLKDTEFARRAKQDAPIAERNNIIPTGTTDELPIGSWQVLHAYHNTYPNGKSNKLLHFNARLYGTINNPYTRISGGGFEGAKREIIEPNEMTISSADHWSYTDKVMLEEGSVSAGYARVPIMLSFIHSFALSVDTASSGSGYDFELGFAPLVLYWNPYNIEMRIMGEQMWSHSVPYKTIWMQYNIADSNGNYSWQDWLFRAHGTDTDWGHDVGNYFLRSRNSVMGDIVFDPGEILFFSPANKRVQNVGNTGYLQTPWAIGYNPQALSGHQATFISGVGDSQTGARSRITLKLGQSSTLGAYQTDGWWFAPHRSECYTIMSGFYGLSKDYNLNVGGLGKGAHSPHRYILGWYDPDDGSLNTNIATDTWDATSGLQNDDDNPYFIAALGLTPKSSNSSMRMGFATGDYRSKIWQHSSPAFFGGYLVDPTEQMRHYHPYQLVNINISSGLSTSPIDNIGDNGLLGLTSDGEQVSFASVSEAPIHPPFSLAGYAGMRLTPGWFDTTDNEHETAATFRRMQYQAGVPGVGIGNSFADPTIPAGDIYVSNDLDYPELTRIPNFLYDFYDHGLLINDALWDRFFTSSVSDMPDKSTTIPARDTLTKFINGEEPLPVSRYIKAPTPYNNEAVINRIMEEDGWKYIAQFLWIEGGFNINSTSVEAWAATLRGLSKRKLVNNVEDRMTIVEPDKDEDDVLFSRFMLSTSDKSIDSLGGYSVVRGSSALRDAGGILTAWGEVRKLSNNDIHELAEKIVEQVRERGPFLNMSDFINRRLDDDNTDHALTGALQAAIDETDINREFEEVMITAVPSGDFYKFPEAARGSMHTAAPGYLIQSDVLMSLGNILTLRDDTFTVRAYGCIRNANGAVLAQAWCEATVQRTMEYVDPTDAPYASEFNGDGSRSQTGLTDTNKTLGRKMKVVSFRWLDHWDI